MKREINTVFADFTQNNSGGYFIINEQKGIGHYIDGSIEKIKK